MHGLFIMYNVLAFSNNTAVYSCFQNLYIIQIFGILVDLVDYVHNKTEYFCDHLGVIVLDEP